MNIHIRNSDVFARLGGDEFVLFLINTSEQQAEKIIVNLNHTLKKYNQEANRGYDIAFSYGIVEFNSEKHHAIEELLVNGDSLMYEVKKAKK